MSYGTYDRFVKCEVEADAKLTPTAWNAAAADLFVFTALDPMLVTRFGAHVTTTFAGQTTDPVISIALRPVPTDSSKDVELGTIEFKNAYAAGKIYVLRLNDVKVLAGQQIAIKMKTQGVASGGGGAGAFSPLFAWSPAPEVAALMPNVVMLPVAQNTVTQEVD